nr:thioredoxin Y1, chloroplastic [Ipomoea batatas]
MASGSMRLVVGVNPHPVSSVLEGVTLLECSPLRRNGDFYSGHHCMLFDYQAPVLGVGFCSFILNYAFAFVFLAIPQRASFSTNANSLIGESHQVFVYLWHWEMDYSLQVEAKKQTFSSLDDLLANYDKPILVDFYATWCGPCQFMVPVLNEVSDSMKDKIQVVKIDTEKYPSIADKYQIKALPTFILFKDGKPCDRFEGALAAKQLIERIESALRS